LASHGRLACSESELADWGTRFGHAASAPLLVTISGELGAGKTTLVRAICRGYGVTEDVTSPTFALVHEYSARNTRVFHLDLYRLRGPGELASIGWDEIVNGDAIVLIEWPERAGDRLPAPRLDITLSEVAGAADTRDVRAEWIA
jgi:tRNA threonylcarbamoyladenosine biosynthesis protein TsaE